MAEIQNPVVSKIPGISGVSEALSDGSLLASHLLPLSVFSSLLECEIIFEHLQHSGFFIVQLDDRLKRAFMKDPDLERRQYRDFYSYDFLLFVLPGKIEEVKPILCSCRISPKPFSKKEISKVIPNEELLHHLYSTYTQFHVKGVALV